ncbi:MAG: AarF/ABC1/UbiB kinase family protein [Oceanicaulis sp.]
MKDRRGRAVPKGRLERAARLGVLGAGLAGSTAAGAAAAWLRGERADFSAHAFSPANARRFAGELSRLRGAALKLGQLVSMDVGAVAPAEFAAAAEALRAGAEPMAPGQLKRVLDRRWGKGWLSRFEHFESRPFAAASIGQVHRAVTRDGRALAVKIQYPGVKASIDADIDGVAALVRLAGVLPKGFDLDPYLEEARQALHREADYAAEARHISAYSNALGDTAGFILPGVDAALSGADILALEFLPGAGIETAAGQDRAERERVFAALLHLTLRELFEMGLMQTDPNFANFLYDGPRAAIGLIDFGAVQDISPPLRELCRAVLRAGLSGDDAAMADALEPLGVLTSRTAPHHRQGVLDLADALFARVRAGAFDFTDTRLLTRLREGGLALQKDGFAPAPPPELMFVQRKFAGLYLLGAKLGVTMDVRGMLEEWACSDGTASPVRTGDL